MNYILSLTIATFLMFETTAQTTSFEYDKLYRLTKISYNNGSVISYQYDANGNRTSQVITGIITEYRFIGNGNWSLAANWLGNNIPPLILPNGAVVIIDPVTNGECVLDVNEQVMPGASVKIMPGKKMRVPGNVIIH